MMYITGEDRERAERLAQLMGAEIEGDISIVMWPLPLLESMHQRIREMDRRLRDIEGRMGE